MQKKEQKIKLKKIKFENTNQNSYSNDKKSFEINQKDLSGTNSLSIISLFKSSFYPKKPKNSLYLSIKHKNTKNEKQNLIKSFSGNKSNKCQLSFPSECHNNLSNTILKKKLKKQIKKVIKENKDKKINKTLKTSREMTKKFYIKNRDAFKGIGKSNDLFSGFIKDPRKIINKILNDYKNIKKYDKEILLNNKNNYERNIEYIENQEKIKEAKRIKDNILFNKLKRKQNNNYYSKSSSFNNINQSESYSHIHLSTINRKSKFKEQTLPSSENIFQEENKLEKRTTNCIAKNKIFMSKKIKLNSIKFCKAINHVDFMCRPYQPINKEISKKNLKRNIYYNVPNLERISKLKTIIKKGFDEDDFESNSKYIKKFSKEYDLMIDKILSGYWPRFIKKGKFNNETIERYNNLQGKYFGLLK